MNRDVWKYNPKVDDPIWMGYDPQYAFAGKARKKVVKEFKEVKKAAEQVDFAEVLKFDKNVFDSDEYCLDIPKTMKLSEQDAFGIIKDFFLQLDHKVLDFFDAKECTYCVHMTQKTRVVMYGAVCHMQLMNRKDKGNLGLGSMFIETKETQDAVDIIRKWMTKETFPWRDIVPYCTPLYNGLSNGKKQTGFFINKQGMDNLYFPFVKNFCVFLRMITEKLPELNVFVDFVKKGMDERDALYLSSFFQKYQNEYHDEVHDNIQGSHWPLSETGFYGGDFQFDWKRFYEGDPRKTVIGNENINHVWMKAKGAEYRKFSYDGKEPHDLDKIIESFEKWKVKHVK